VSSARYLGVYINSTLFWNTHIDTTEKKATQSLNFLWRNFTCCPVAIHEQCYKTFVRPQLEYASSVWDNPVRRLTSPVVTSNVHQVSQPCYRNFSEIHFNSVELIAESLFCVAFAVVWWWPFLLQLTSNRLQPTPEGLKPDTNRHSAIHTAIPSFLLQFACEILYQSTFANCHQTASKLN